MQADNAAWGFRRWRERRRTRLLREREIVGVVWVWDHPVALTRKYAEWAELHVLPFGVYIISDNRSLLDGR